MIVEYRFADRMNRFASSSLRDILKRTQGDAVISFAGGLPAEEWFPMKDIAAAYANVFGEGADGRRRGSLQYGITEGFLPLREQLAERMKAKGITARPEQLLLTTGSQQSIDLAARVFLNEGDVVLVESPTYLAALQVFQSVSARILPIGRDDEGIDPDHLEKVASELSPKLLYVSPTFSNPCGAVWSRERRSQVLQLCLRYGIMILEDDPYGELSFQQDSSAPATAFPSLYSLYGEKTGNPVLYTSTFSKTVAPALRTGWAIADDVVIRQMAKAKQAADLHSSLVDQQALSRLLLDFDLDEHIRGLRRVYRERMEVMAEKLETDPIWRGTHWVKPKGGLFLWLELPETMNTSELFQTAVEHGVAFVPGSGFYPAEPRTHGLRLNFSHSSPERIREGMNRLSASYARYLS